MKNNKLKIIAFILVLIVLILLIILFVIKVTNYSIKDSEYNNVNDNKAYIEHRDKNHKTVDKLKTVLAKDDNIEQINTYLKNVHFNGSITVLKDGKLMLDKGYGYQNISSKKKSNANTMYLIGSAQKFTTGLILKHLELSNKININDPVTKYLPWFKTNKTITLKDLMLHRSGLYKFSANPNTKSLDGAVHDIQRRGINSKYYHKHLYNDANYLVLAQVIEAVTHHSYVENYYKFLAEPYHLEHSAFFNEKPYKKNMATGYKVKNGKLKTMKPNTLDQYYGAGNLFMSTHDMARLVNDLQQNNIFNQAVTTSLLQEIGSTKYPESYRYGFYSTPQVNRINGVFFGQIFTVYFNEDYIIVLATNKVDYSKVSNESIISHIYYQLLGQNIYETK
ncbi:serine hydrolase domain-containing protein [Staphylococcus haemolyticus]|uniref:serine hydrolase domain-containing protein n=1 Tax=Staphylococcus haemolyticus TaxID=1283 RepID=UPI002900A7B6|nr:serine hydrolase domain-containing protein [Staphylococcus haemolyticus]MDU0423736.1 serine hydrolase domain-containing protein [Staphylococcus haemolyticus]MDU0438866.1 serine hydrolase domain-containing protein [Staphylococcus haemolyticus]MDU0444945.1 serine hydrolase domain-containing protein [Staphylococcus haemolyticus]MDU0448686.1 serine hydrolase domain-containing protein [Staphylococcus haemolyticus]MDU0486695.1 serine hydrolase domain-containing protein [Staphylococcus haemolyticu